jgi:hypothetical protein
VQPFAPEVHPRQIIKERLGRIIRHFSDQLRRGVLQKPGHALLYCSGELSRLETVPHPCFAPLWYMSISLQAVS